MIAEFFDIYPPRSLRKRRKEKSFLRILIIKYTRERTNYQERKKDAHNSLSVTACNFH